MFLCFRLWCCYCVSIGEWQALMYSMWMNSAKIELRCVIGTELQRIWRNSCTSSLDFSCDNQSVSLCLKNVKVTVNMTLASHHLNRHKEKNPGSVITCSTRISIRTNGLILEESGGWLVLEHASSVVVFNVMNSRSAATAVWSRAQWWQCGDCCVLYNQYRWYCTQHWWVWWGDDCKERPLCACQMFSHGVFFRASVIKPVVDVLRSTEVTFFVWAQMIQQILQQLLSLHKNL